MTPQPRHIEAAEKIVYAFMDDPNKISVRGDLTPMIAHALAEAENRAAWDVKQNQPDESTYEWLEAKYGPRPTTENQA